MKEGSGWRIPPNSPSTFRPETKNPIRLKQEVQASTSSGSSIGPHITTLEVPLLEEKKIASNSPFTRPREDSFSPHKDLQPQKLWWFSVGIPRRISYRLAVLSPRPSSSIKITKTKPLMRTVNSSCCAERHLERKDRAREGHGPKEGP
jgi:hypothetical protein